MNDSRTARSILVRASSSLASTSSYAANSSSWNDTRISSTIDSLESKWWYRLPERIPDASAMSRTVVFLNPFSAKRPAAIASSSARLPLVLSVLVSVVITVPSRRAGC